MCPPARKLSRSANFLQSLVQRLHLALCADRDAQAVVILELRGGLIVSKLLEVPITTAIPLCIIGNIIPIPFILLFIKQIFKWMKKIRLFRVFFLYDPYFLPFRNMTFSAGPPQDHAERLPRDVSVSTKAPRGARRKRLT